MFRYIHPFGRGDISLIQDYSPLTLHILRSYNYLTQSHMICYSESCLLRCGSSSFPTLARLIGCRPAYYPTRSYTPGGPDMSTTTGLEDVVVADSSICDLDGKHGKLTYCGVDIHDLAEHSSFEETAYLLWHGALPTRAQLEGVRTCLCAQRALPKRVMDLMHLLPTTTAPMDVLRTTVSALAAFDPEAHETSVAVNYRRALRLTARLSTIVTAWEHIRNGREPIAPLPDADHATNFLYMLTGKMPDPYAAQVLDVALILHADHELNASTFAARVTTGTCADMYA